MFPHSMPGIVKSIIWLWRQKYKILGGGIASRMCLVSDNGEAYSRHEWLQVGLTYGESSIQGTGRTHEINKQI